MNRIIYKNYIVYTAILLFAGMLVLWSCKKPEGDYSYVNMENSFNGTDYDYLVSKTGTYDSLVKAIDRISWLKDSLSNPSNELTVFAPSNSSFNLIITTLNIARENAGKDPVYINNLDLDNLDTLISRYVVHGSITTSAIQFVDGIDITSVLYNYPMQVQKSFSEANGYQGGGPTNIIFSDTKKSQFIRDWVRTQTNVVNIVTANGIVNSLEPEHEIGFGEFVTRFNK